MLNGIDFSYGSGVTTAQIKSAGYQFVCRYLSGSTLGSNGKNVSAAEVKNYVAAGLPVVFVWEGTGTDATSMANGVADAQHAQNELIALANTLGDQKVAQTPVYFAVDEETASDVVGYLNGAASVLGKKRTGVYGGLHTIQQAFNADCVAYGWQTYAWSSGAWDNRALLRQVKNDVKVGPCDADHDQVAYWGVSTPVFGAGDDFGQYPAPVKTSPAAPSAPVKPSGSSASSSTSKPVAGAPGKLQSPTRSVDLSWNPSHEGAEYHLEVSNASGAVVSDQPNLKVPAATVNGLTPGSKYTWRVYVMADSTHAASDWSDSKEFTA